MLVHKLERLKFRKAQIQTFASVWLQRDCVPSALCQSPFLIPFSPCLSVCLFPLTGADFQAHAMGSSPNGTRRRHDQLGILHRERLSKVLSVQSFSQDGSTCLVHYTNAKRQEPYLASNAHSS